MPDRPRLPPAGTHGGPIEEHIYEHEVVYDYDYDDYGGRRGGYR